MKTLPLTAIVLGLALLLTQSQVKPVFADPAEKITICHGAGRDTTIHFETLTLSRNAVFQDQGEGGHFYENGTPKAGHEQDYLGECRSSDPSPSSSPFPSPSPSASVSPTPSPTPSTDPSLSPSSSPLVSSTPSPSENNSPSSNSNSSGGSSSSEGTSNPSSSGEVLGAYAATGVVEDVMMNAVGVLGGLLTTTGSIMYGKKKRA